MFLKRPGFMDSSVMTRHASDKAIYGAPGGIRTPNLLIRRLDLASGGVRRGRPCAQNSLRVHGLVRCRAGLVGPSGSQNGSQTPPLSKTARVCPSVSAQELDTWLARDRSAHGRRVNGGN
jgi:hypothetical protein